jgi:hypothetical protein
MDGPTTLPPAAAADYSKNPPRPPRMRMAGWAWWIKDAFCGLGRTSCSSPDTSRNFPGMNFAGVPPASAEIVDKWRASLSQTQKVSLKKDIDAAIASIAKFRHAGRFRNLPGLRKRLAGASKRLDRQLGQTYGSERLKVR